MGSEGQLEGSEGQLEGSEGQSEGSEGQPEGFEKKLILGVRAVFGAPRVLYY